MWTQADPQEGGWGECEKTGAEIGRITWGFQKLEEARKCLFPRGFR
jgi:hypothetical protein